MFFRKLKTLAGMRGHGKLPPVCIGIFLPKSIHVSSDFLHLLVLIVEKGTMNHTTKHQPPPTSHLPPPTSQHPQPPQPPPRVLILSNLVF